MFGKQRSDVLVVGAGPTGLFTALRLVESGVNVRILDRHWRTGAHSYALALHPRSLELLDEARLTSALLEQGRRVDRVAFRDGGDRCGEIELAKLSSKFPFALVVPQSVLEGELENRLLKQKVKVRWNQRLERLRQEGAEMVGDVAHLDRVAAGYPIARSEWSVVKTSKAIAGYVVGADGYHSQVRQHLEIEFQRFGPQSTYAVYEFETESDPGHELSVMFDAQSTSAMWPMVGNRCRFSFQIEHADDYAPTEQRLARFLEQRAPWFSPGAGRIIWTSVVQFDRRLAAGFGRGRVWLAGDAVHLTSPVGVQSMNSGLVDAHEIAWRLAEMLTGDRGDDVLSSYEPERLAELKPLFGDPASFAAPEGAPPWVRKHWPRLVSALPATGRHLVALLEQVGPSSRAS